MRPIDGDTVDKVIYEEIPLAYFCGRSLTSANKNVAAIRERIEQIPTLDAVPVVRCKDCKWSVPATNGKGQNGYRCKCSNSPVYETFWWLEGDWFCADGEPKEDA